MAISFPPYRPTSWELQLPNYRVITNSWRSTEIPEILGSLPEDARLRLRYENITDQQALELLLLWRATAGGYYPLDPLPAAVTAGINDAALVNRIRSIAPLSWVVADPPRQESIKNLRSGLDIELKSELRFVPILCAGFVPPVPAVAPDMWASRCIADIRLDASKPSSIVMCDSGNSYQVAGMELVTAPEVYNVLVIKRDVEGVVLWQRELLDLKVLEFFAWQQDFFVLAVGTSEQLFVGIRGCHQVRYSVGATSGLAPGTSDSDGKIFSVSTDGALLWQKTYAIRNVEKTPGVIGDAVFDFRLQGLSYNPVTDSLLAMASAGGANSNSDTESIALLSINISSGEVINSGTIWAEPPAGQPTANNFGIAGFVFRGGRLYVYAASTTPFEWSWIAEVSLDFQTVFQSAYFAEQQIWQWVPASDGGWYAFSRSSSQGQAHSFYKFSSGFSPVWGQFATAANRTVFAKIASVGFQPHSELVENHGGKPVYSTGLWPYSSSANASTIDAPANFSVGSRGALIVKFDHEVALNADWATAACFLDIAVGSSDHAAGVAHRHYNDSLGIAVSSRSGNNLPAQSRLVACGFRTPYSDEGERYLDAGTGENAAFFMVARSEIGSYQQVSLYVDPNDLPVRVSVNFPSTAHSVSTLDPGFAWATSSHPFQHYLYNDPAFTVPVTAGDAGLGFYTGNNAVQEVNVGRVFTPALVLHANRNNGGGGGNAGVKIAFSSESGWDRYKVTSSTTQGTTPNGVLDAGVGYFKISGRLLGSIENWNQSSVDYLALALGLLDQGHSSASYVGNGESSQVVAHGLGEVPALVMLIPRFAQSINVGGSAVGANQYLTTSSAAARLTGRIASFDASNITLSSPTILSAAGQPWTMHSFASSAAWDIGTYQGDGTGTHTQSLGYQPKALILKNIIGNTGDWWLLFRADDTPGVARAIPLSTTAAEDASADVSLTADGFTVLQGGTGNTGTVTALYFAIR